MTFITDNNRSTVICAFIIPVHSKKTEIYKYMCYGRQVSKYSDKSQDAYQNGEKYRTIIKNRADHLIA